MNSNYNNIYMFKNPVRFFLDPESLDYPSITTMKNDLDLIEWSTPITFSIRKYYGSCDLRILKLPNYLTFYYLYSYCKNMNNFNTIEKINAPYSRINVNLKTGDFKAYQYQKNIESDLLKLTYYERLYKFDIKSFYSRIYTHKVVQYTGFFINNEYNDRYITNINAGKTNEIMMGNYISLYLAELLLKDIIKKIKEEFKNNNIENSINYFSDDIYIFGYIKDKNKINDIVSKVLSEFDLEQNNEKQVEYDYLSYNENNILIKYWKRVISKQKNYNLKVDIYNCENEKEQKYYMNFTNQIIYRLSLLKDEKLKGIFVKNFFKSNFFYKLNMDNYKFIKENIHQFMYLISMYPEILLYIIPKFKSNKYFVDSIVDWLKNRLLKKSNDSYYEEQLYLLYSLNLLGKEKVDDVIFNKLMETDNQILKSYLIMYNLPLNIDPLNYLKSDEKYWFINYHIILKSKELGNQNYSSLIESYLIPQKILDKIKNNNSTINQGRFSNYYNFYLCNIQKNNPLIKSYEKVEKTIDDYLKDKVEERENDGLAQDIME